MSTIDRLNGVTAVDIASVDNVGASAIASINGMLFASGSTISAITNAGTQSNIITGGNDANINGRGVELQLGRYVYILAQK